MLRNSVYLIDDDDDFRASLKQSLELADISVTDFNAPETALEHLDEEYAHPPGPRLSGQLGPGG